MKPQLGGKLHNQRGWFPLPQQLLCHFIRDNSAETVTPKIVRSCALHFTNFRKIVCRDLFERGVPELAAIHSFRFDSVKWLLGIHLCG